MTTQEIYELMALYIAEQLEDMAYNYDYEYKYR
jgi:hypothetical protein